MKILRAEFLNFRLLRDLELHFGSDSEKKLTVIRAANESGKTTILTGLQWAFYGDAALPGKGDGFRLHPIDWTIENGAKVPITATVDFELTSVRQSATGTRETRKRYQLVRSAYEDIDSSSRRSASSVKLFELTETGADLIQSPEAFINDELPAELREVFFTDGDRALSFIEADVAISTKRERVQRAIRSLLGLGVIEDAIKHVRRVSSDVNKQAKEVGGGTSLSQIATRLELLDGENNKLEAQLEDTKQQFRTMDELLDEIDRNIAGILQKGDREKLQKDLELANREIKKLDQELKSAIREHSDLFRGSTIATDLLGTTFNAAYLELKKLHDQGKIPNNAVPVLQDRLLAELCICGESLREGDPDSDRRRNHIKNLIEDSQRASDYQETVTALYYKAQSTQSDNELHNWKAESKRVIERRDRIQDLRDEAGRKFRALELQLDSVPDSDIQGLRQTRRQYKEQRDRALHSQSAIETRISSLGGERNHLVQERDRLLKDQKKGARILAELQVIHDVTQVLQKSYDMITEEELTKVSTLMNEIFLEMIGSDPEQGAIIQRAEISSEFDIIVYGPNERTLNPDRDLNGASRRALTLAFILALTKVSEVEAPNVIDTPLGMTSGYVKRSILKAAIRESSQLILFLTPDEIKGCEDIIDQFAGVVTTLTNPAHYPKMLVNNPNMAERKVLKCACDHNQDCDLCRRRSDQDIGIEANTGGGRYAG